LPSPLPENLHSILEKGVLAPSGDNMQPWKFAIKEDYVDFYIDEPRLVAFWDDGLRAPYIAAGAVLQNLRIASEHQGYGLDIEYLPESVQPSWVARLRWHPQSPRPQELYSFLTVRCTNRKFYRSGQLTEADWQTLNETQGPLKILWVKKGAEGFSKVCDLFQRMDRLRFENETIHRGLIHGLRFGGQVSSSRDGLDVKTLEVGPDFMLKGIASWERCKALNYVGLSRMLSFVTGLQMNSSLAAGFIVSSERSPLTFLKAGELFQRVWLKVTRLKLALQPMSTLPLFITYMQYSSGTILSEAQRKETLKAKEIVYPLLDIPAGSELVFAFRVGFADEPSARSLRRDLESFLIK